MKERKDTGFWKFVCEYQGVEDKTIVVNKRNVWAEQILKNKIHNQGCKRQY